MKDTIPTLAQLNQRAREILIREMGAVDAIRFLGQFSGGSGDYTAERQPWIDALSLKEISSQIRGKGRSARRSKS